MERTISGTEVSDDSDGIPTITYYNISGGLDYENELLEGWGMAGKRRTGAGPPCRCTPEPNRR